MSATTSASLLERWCALHVELQEASLTPRRGVDIVEVPRWCSIAVAGLAPKPAGTQAPGVLLRALVDTPPGQWSDAQCSALRGIDSGGLSQRDLLDYVEVIERHKAHLDAAQIVALAVLERRDSSGMQAVREDVACVLRITPLAAAGRELVNFSV